MTRLPFELLSLVFLYLRESTPDSTWLRTLHVCRQWRSTAIGCPTLWTYISTTSNRSLRLFMLKQSKQFSITLRGLRIVKDRSPETNKILDNNFHRIRELGLTFETCHLVTVIEWVARVLDAETAPLLKILKLCLERTADFFRGIPVPDVTLNPQSLTVMNCPLEFPTDRTQENLTSFRIDAPCHWLASRNSRKVTYLHRTLSVMPNLTQLHNSDRSLVSPYGSYSGHCVTLPYLETLHYTGIVVLCLHVLQLLKLPPTTRFALRMTDSSDYDI